MTGMARILAALLVCAAPAFGAQDPIGQTDGLEFALRLTTTAHPSVKSQISELQALGYDRASAESQRYPVLALQANSTSSVSGPTPNDGDDVHNVIAVVRQPVWVGGRIDGRIDQAAIKQEIGKLSLFALKRQLMESTVASYSRVQGSRKQLAAAQLNVLEHERLKELIARRETGGIASQADVQLASSRLSQAVSQQLQIDADLRRAQNELEALTQQQVAALAPVEARQLLLPPDSLIPEQVERGSAKLQQRLIEVDLARNNVDLSTSEMLPNLYARLEQDLYGYANDRELTRGTRVGLVMEGSVDGLGLSSWNRVRSAKARVDAAEQGVADTRNELQRETRALLTDLKSLQLVEQSNALLVASSAETLASFMRQYDAGRKSWVDVLNAQREASQARIALEQTSNSLMEVKLRLAVKLGQFDDLVVTESSLKEAKP